MAPTTNFDFLEATEINDAVDEGDAVNATSATTTPIADQVSEDEIESKDEIESEDEIQETFAEATTTGAHVFLVDDEDEDDEAEAIDIESTENTEGGEEEIDTESEEVSSPRLSKKVRRIEDSEVREILGETPDQDDLEALTDEEKHEEKRARRLMNRATQEKKSRKSTKRGKGKQRKSSQDDVSSSTEEEDARGDADAPKSKYLRRTARWKRVEKTETQVTNGILFATHHKTGSKLSSKSRKCLKGLAPVDMKQPLTDGNFSWDRRVVHFVRNSFALALSNYLHNRNIGESWTQEPGSARKFMEPQKDLLGDVYKHLGISSKESYTDMLQRVSMKLGMLAEMVRMQDELDLIEKADEECTAHPKQCMKVCVEKFTLSTASFDRTWRDIVDFAQIDGPRTLIRKCLRQFDLHQKGAQRSKSGMISEGRVASLMRTAKKLDAKYLNGRLNRLSLGALHCHTSMQGLESSSKKLFAWNMQEQWA